MAAFRQPGNMVYVYASALTLFNLLFWVGILFNLPGTWLMVLAAAGTDWLRPGEAMFSGSSLYLCGGLALLGEVFEFFFGAAGSRRAGGSKRAAVLAILGGIVGAIFGTALPLPIVGTLLGACAGAFAGSLLGDAMAGRPLAHSVAAGRGAAAGRLWGTIAKMTVGAAIVLILAVDAYT